MIQLIMTKTVYEKIIRLIIRIIVVMMVYILV